MDQQRKLVLVNSVFDANRRFAAGLLVGLGNGWIVLAKTVPPLLGKALRQDRAAGDLRILWQELDAIGSGAGGLSHNHGHRHQAVDTPHRFRPEETTNVAGLEKP